MNEVADCLVSSDMDTCHNSCDVSHAEQRSSDNSTGEFYR